jgi:peptidoglycan/LPS O-acetylase OafA/YrhL
MASWPPPPRPQARISQLPHLRGLDGLRAIAVTAVVLYHANHEWLSGGFLGVEIFFVISGYLITLLLIAEHERTGRVRLGQFWLRRARRLLPALFVMMGLVATYLALFNRRPQGRTRGDFLGGVFYGSNWYQIAVGQGYTAAEAFAPLRHLWSLAVEEQFYLLWPLVMLVLLKTGRERLPRIAVWLVVLSATISLAMAILFVPGDVTVDCSGATTRGYARLLGRCINVNEALYLGTFTRVGGILLGAAFAMLWRPLALMRGPMRRKGHLLDLIAMFGLIVLFLQMTQLTLAESGQEFGERFDPWLFRGGFFITGLATLCVIAAITHRGAYANGLLGNPLFNWIGTRSYGLYLFHWPIYQIIRKSAGVSLTFRQFLVAMVITLPITELSYRYIEMPIRERRFRLFMRPEQRVTRVALYRNRRRVVMVVAATSAMLGFAGVSLAVAKNVCVGDIECSLQDTSPAEAVVADPPTPTVTSVPTVTTPVAGVDHPSSIPSETAAPPVTTIPETTTTPAPPPPPPPVALGESVMLGAKDNLEIGGFYVDAIKSRQGEDMAALVEAMRANGQLGQTVVIQIGTNGSVSQETFARIMAQLPPELTPQVVFLTIHVPKRWNDGNNALIRALPTIYPNVTVLDWDEAAKTIHICSDGIHIACGSEMSQFYANLIFDAVGRPELKR